MSRKERHFQGITRAIRNFSENDYFRIIFRKQKLLCQRVMSINVESTEGARWWAWEHSPGREEVWGL